MKLIEVILKASPTSGKFSFSPYCSENPHGEILYEFLRPNNFLYRFFQNDDFEEWYVEVLKFFIVAAQAKAKVRYYKLTDSQISILLLK